MAQSSSGPNTTPRYEVVQMISAKSIAARIEDLARAFNQLRQTAITEELLDVVSGFEALGGAADTIAER